jgi:hypothetical protein
VHALELLYVIGDRGPRRKGGVQFWHDGFTLVMVGRAGMLLRSQSSFAAGSTAAVEPKQWP